MLRLLALAFLLPATAWAQPDAGTHARPVVVDGMLSPASDTLTSGEYKHVVEVPAQAGDRIVALMTTADFDPYLILTSPTGAQYENDDCIPGDRTRSCLDWTADTTGLFRVIATSYTSGETGRFVLTVGTSAAGAPRAVQCPALSGGSSLAGTVEYAVLFAPDGAYLRSEATASAPPLQVAVDRVIAGCRAAPLPSSAPQLPQSLVVTFRFPAD